MTLTDGNLDYIAEKCETYRRAIANGEVFHWSVQDVASHVPALLADLRTARATIDRVEAVADDWQTRHRRGDHTKIDPWWAGNAVFVALEGAEEETQG